MDSREIRRRSAYLLHWYGVPRLRGGAVDEISPSWEKLRLAAEQAREWLDSIYLIECGVDSSVDTIALKIDEIKNLKSARELMVVIDDCQRLGDKTAPLDARLPVIVEQLQALAAHAKLPLLAVWPDLTGRTEAAPHVWAERVVSADVIVVMENDATRTKQLTEADRAITLHIVKSRGGERGRLAFEFQPAFANFTEIV
jgi:hypothetical protein